MSPLNDISISDFDEKRKLIVARERHFLANEMTIDLIQTLRNSATMEDARLSFCNKHGVTLSSDEFGHVIADKLYRYGLLDNQHDGTVGKAGYLKLKVQILSEETVAHIANWFSSLFIKEVFWTLLIVSIAVNAVNFASFISGEAKISGLVLSILLFGFSTAIHEVGHVSACRHFGSKHGGMGFGFYFIWPVAYSDISGVWSLKKYERVLVNLAGIYMQLFYAALLIAAGLLTNIKDLNLVAAAVSITAIVQLNPFLRMDGYWVLSDLTEQPNLLPTASRGLRALFLSIYHSLTGTASMVEEQRKNKSLFVLLYGIANMSIGIIFMVLIYVNYTESIIHFPETTLTIIRGILRGTFLNQELTFSYLTALVFYVLSTTNLKSALSIIIKNQKLLFPSKPEKKKH